MVDQPEVDDHSLTLGRVDTRNIFRSLQDSYSLQSLQALNILNIDISHIEPQLFTGRQNSDSLTDLLVYRKDHRRHSAFQSLRHTFVIRVSDPVDDLFDRICSCGSNQYTIVFSELGGTIDEGSICILLYQDPL